MNGAAELPANRDERVRLFVALELPEQICDALIAWRDRSVGRMRQLRRLPAESLHATLCFLGWQDAGQSDAIAAACAALAPEPAPLLSLGDPRWLPPRRPRVLAVELGDHGGALTRAQALLSEVLAAGGWYEPEKRPYLAHVTVARVAHGDRAPREPLPEVPSAEFHGSRVTLYRSRLRRSGASYQPLATVELRSES